VFSTYRFGVAILLATSAVSAETAHWEPGKVISVEQVSTPAKTQDPDCHTMPRGETLPARCRTANLRAQQYWTVTVEVGPKRYVVRPYRAPKLLDSLNQEGPIYVDPQLKVGTNVEVAVYANKSLRLRIDKGDGLPAVVDSEEMLSKPEVQQKFDAPPAPRAAPTAAILTSTASKIVLLENGDFIDLEAQELKSQDIGDGAALYSFAGDSSQTRVSSNRPVFLVMGGEAGVVVNLELARLQVGKGTRQLLYSLVKKHSASPIAISVTQTSDTLRRVTVNEPLQPGEYVLVLEGSNRAFLFQAR
jgi:hypothetical protein